MLLFFLACTGSGKVLDDDGDGFLRPDDCDDQHAEVHPGATEGCDGVDHDCNGLVDDEPADGIPGFVDDDGDGYGDPTRAETACTGVVTDATDCDDGRATVHPGAPEAVDGVDTDCDGLGEWTGDFTLTTSLDLQELCQEADVVAGRLVLVDTPSVDFSELSCLEGVGGNLEFRGSRELQSLAGLSNLRFVDGNLVFSYEMDIPNLKGLEKLQRIGGDLQMDMSLWNGSLEGLSGLTSLGGSVLLDSVFFQDFHGLSSLKEIPGDFSVDGNVQSLRGLEGITRIGGDLSIRGAQQLPHLSGLDGLTNIGGSLRLDETQELTSLEGLNSLQSIGGDLYLTQNPSLANLDGFSSLREVGGLIFIGALGDGSGDYDGDGTPDSYNTGNPALLQVNALGGLQSVGRSVTIIWNYQLPDADALAAISAIPSVGGTIFVEHNSP